jgi:hypothetical protein
MMTVFKLPPDVNGAQRSKSRGGKRVKLRKDYDADWQDSYAQLWQVQPAGVQLQFEPA